MVSAKYDVEALKQDIPNAKELAQFVFDKTGKSLDLVGKNKDVAYKTAIEVLEGRNVQEHWYSDSNPYIDRKDDIPEDPLKELPAKSKKIPGEEELSTFFHATNFPHPIKPDEYQCNVTFRKYLNNVLTYEITGPVFKVAVGTKKNKHGQDIPEKYTWIDSRTEERMMRNENGSYTPDGLKLQQFCLGEKGGNIWSFIDKPLNAESVSVANPW